MLGLHPETLGLDGDLAVSCTTRSTTLTTGACSSGQNNSQQHTPLAQCKDSLAKATCPPHIPRLHRRLQPCCCSGQPLPVGSQVTAGLGSAGCWHQAATPLFEAALLAAQTAQGCDLQGTRYFLSGCCCCCCCTRSAYMCWPQVTCTVQQMELRWGCLRLVWIAKSMCWRGAEQS